MAKQKGWLDKYGEEINANEGHSSAPKEWMGEGYSNVGRDYSPAWGGQFKDGGKKGPGDGLISLPNAQRFTFLEPTSSKLPIGYANVPSNIPSSELAQSVGGENGEPAFLIPTFKYGHPLEDAGAEFRRTGEHLGGPFKTWQEADEWERTVRHPYVEKGQDIPTPLRRWGKDFAMGGSLPGATGFMYARTGAPSNGPYAKKTLPSAQNGLHKKYLPEKIKGWAEPKYVAGQNPEGHYGYSDNTIWYDPNSEIENVNNPWWMGHEQYHHYQTLTGENARERRGQEVGNEVNKMIQANPELQFVPINRLIAGSRPDEKGRKSFLGAEDRIYEDPSTVEGAARLYEQYIDNGGKSIFPKPNLNSTNNYPTESAPLRQGLNFKNGGMTYYQNGLDWKPKSISKNGSEVSQAQVGKEVSEEVKCGPNQVYLEGTGCIDIRSRMYKELYESGKLAMKGPDDSVIFPTMEPFVVNSKLTEDQKAALIRKELRETSVQNQTSIGPAKEQPWYQRAFDIATHPGTAIRAYNTMGYVPSNLGATAENMGGPSSIINSFSPITWGKAAYNAGKQFGSAPIQTTKDVLAGTGNLLGYGLHAIDSPLPGKTMPNYVSPFGDAGTNARALEFTGNVLEASPLLEFAPFVKGALKPIVAESMETGLLSKAYKLNPWAFKPNASSAYRMIGNEKGLASALESGYLKPSTTGSDIGKIHTNAHYTMGAPSDARKYFGRTWNREYPGPYMAEVPNAVNDVRISSGIGGKEMGADVFTFPENYIPTSEANIYKQDWLRGYKKVSTPTAVSSSIESEAAPIIQGATENDVTQSVIDKYFRRQELPESTNSNLTSVLDDFRQRMQTPEGQERLKALGITSDDYLKELKLIEDEYSYGYHMPNEGKVAIHPEAGGQLARNAIRHEIEHAVQESFRRSNIDKVRAAENKDFWGSMLKKNRNSQARLAAMESGPTEIDDILSGLELRKEGTNPDWKEIFKNSPQFKEKVNWHDIRPSFKNDTQKATDYFLTGSEGQEKAPFLAEVQQYMLDKGYIKHPYENITPDKVKEVFAEGRFDEESPLRIFNIMKASDKNYDLISKALNKMLTVTPIVGGAAAATYQAEKKKQGGVVKDDRGYWNPDNWGKVVEIDSPDITMEGVYEPLIGESKQTGEKKLMLPGKKYKFANTNQVIERPVAKNGINQQDEKVDEQLDQLTNFTNYNKPTKGGWLDKYN